MRRRALGLVLPFVLAGCGGGGHDSGNSIVCPALAGYPSNAAYAGAFGGTYSETGAAFVRLTLQFTVAADGTLTGTLNDAETGETGLAVTGAATDFVSGCEADQAAVRLAFTPKDGTPQNLTLYKKRNGSLPGTFSGTRTPDPQGGGTGFLVVAKAASG